ncbi:hypothetical protein E4U09_002412 [Claviceps aff. purpurea]|uniref:Uncharacterized protein n=1 Tax=Claviceps aff. purpurea TaxID=1967640 RepID=A0A9P7QHV7_9HYPO|nr:hypothetical protein E4U09_002412 [Claviceps aff. purpurea]
MDDSKRIMSSQAKGGKDMSHGSFAATAQHFGDPDDNKKNMSATSGKDYAPRAQSSQVKGGGEMSSGGFPARTQSSAAAASATNENAKGPSGQSAFGASATRLESGFNRTIEMNWEVLMKDAINNKRRCSYEPQTLDYELCKLRLFGC